MAMAIPSMLEVLTLILMLRISLAYMGFIILGGAAMHPYMACWELLTVKLKYQRLAPIEKQVYRME